MAGLYVRPLFCGKALGGGLARRSLDAARELACKAIRLCTLPSMATAVSLYTSMGFREIEPYTEHPLEGGVYMEYVF